MKKCVVVVWFNPDESCVENKILASHFIFYFLVDNGNCYCVDDYLFVVYFCFRLLFQFVLY